MATAVLAPFRLTWLLSPLLRRSGDANIVTLSSGGMYTQPFDLARLEMPPEEYRGTTAYAAGQAGAGRPVPRVGPPLERGRGRQLRRASRLGGHARAGQRAAVVRQARPAAADARTGGRHRGLAGRRRSQAPRPGGPVWWRGSSTTGAGGASTTCPGRVRGAGATDGARLWEWCQSRTDLRGRTAGSVDDADEGIASSPPW